MSTLKDLKLPVKPEKPAYSRNPVKRTSQWLEYGKKKKNYNQKIKDLDLEYQERVYHLKKSMHSRQVGGKFPNVKDLGTHLDVNGKVVKNFHIMRYGKNNRVSFGVLDTIISECNLPIRYSIIPIELDSETLVETLRTKNAELQGRELKLSGILGEDSAPKVEDPYITAQIANIGELQAKIADEVTKGFITGINITITADSEEIIRQSVSKLKTSMQRAGFLMEEDFYMQYQGFVSTLPLCDNKTGKYVFTDSHNLACIFPAVSPITYNPSPQSYYLGEVSTNGTDFVFNFKDSSIPNPHWLVVATSGGGKTFMIRKRTVQDLASDRIVIQFDCEGETLYPNRYGKKFADEFKANVIDFQGVDPKTGKIDGIDIMGTKDPIIITNFLSARFKDRDNIDKLYTAISKWFKDCQEKTQDPTLQSWVMFLKDYKPEWAEIYEHLIEDFGLYAGMFTGKKSIDCNSKYNIFRLNNIPKSIRGQVILAIIDMIDTLIFDAREVVIYCDEAYLLWQDPICANYLAEVTKRGRKHLTSFVFITQDLKDLEGEAEKIFNNTGTKILFKSEHKQATQIVKDLGLGIEPKIISKLPVGECLILVGEDIHQVKISATDEEIMLYDSKKLKEGEEPLTKVIRI
jgi:AAA-like domain